MMWSISVIATVYVVAIFLSVFVSSIQYLTEVFELPSNSSNRAQNDINALFMLLFIFNFNASRVSFKSNFTGLYVAVSKLYCMLEFFHKRTLPWVWTIFTNSLNNDCTLLFIHDNILLYRRTFVFDFNFLLKEEGVGVFGFTVLVIFHIGFSVSAFITSGFSVLVSIYSFQFFFLF